MGYFRTGFTHSISCNYYFPFPILHLQSRQDEVNHGPSLSQPCPPKAGACLPFGNVLFPPPPSNCYCCCFSLGNKQEDLVPTPELSGIPIRCLP